VVSGLAGDPLSRRGLLRALSASGAALALAACGDRPDRDAAGRPVPGPADDVDLLNAALELEHLAVAAYGEGARVARGEVGRLVREYRDFEREHADELRKLIGDLGGTPRKARPDYDFRTLRSGRDVLRFAAELEATAVTSYIAALPRLSQPELRGVAGAILTVEAEQLAVLRDGLGQPAVPEAFVTGRGG
jgi:rubrerythrin